MVKTMKSNKDNKKLVLKEKKDKKGKKDKKEMKDNIAEVVTVSDCCTECGVEWLDKGYRTFTVHFVDVFFCTVSLLFCVLHSFFCITRILTTVALKLLQPLHCRQEVDIFRQRPSRTKEEGVHRLVLPL
jgi:hypothetical protein